MQNRLTITILVRKRRPIWKHTWISAIRTGGNLTVLNMYNSLLRGILLWHKKSGDFVCLFCCFQLLVRIQFLVILLFVGQFFSLNLKVIYNKLTHIHTQITQKPTKEVWSKHTEEKKTGLVAAIQSSTAIPQMIQKGQYLQLLKPAEIFT